MARWLHLRNDLHARFAGRRAGDIAFDIGIEIGRLLIVLALWPMFHFIAGRFPKRIAAVRWAVALPCILVATIWTGECAMQILRFFAP